MVDVDETRIREALTRVLASDGLVASPTLAAFLRYVVEETLAGRGDRLKAYTIAVAALDRPSSFDPNDNPLVRVQARRLRNALARYYAGPGRDDPLRIDLPLGGYVPEFHGAGDAPPPLVVVEDEAEPLADEGGGSGPLATPPARPTRRGSFGAHLALLVAAVIFAVVLALRLIPVPPSEPAADLVVEPSGRGLQTSRILPLLLIDVDLRGAVGEVDPDLYRRRLEGFALRFDDRVVVTRRSPIFPAAPGQPFYHLRVSIKREGASLNAYFQLLHGYDERVIASRAVHLGQSMRAPAETGPTTTTPEDLAGLREMIQTSGPIWTDVARHEDVTQALACLTRAEQFMISASADTWGPAVDCLEATLAANPDLVPALVRLADLYMAEYRRAQVSRRADPLAEAQTLIGRATVLAPGSSAPRQRRALLHLLRGDPAGALPDGARAVDANPHDLAAVGDYGIALVGLGRYADAIPYLWRAIDETALPPPLIRWYAFVALNNLGRVEEADLQAAALAGTRSPIGLTAVLIRAHRRGDDTGVRATRAAIAVAEPDLGVDPRAALARRGLAAPVVDRLLVDLDAAGLRATP